MSLENSLQDLVFGDWAESLLPDFVLAFTLFTAVIYAVLGKRFDRQRPAITVSVALGLALSVGLVWWERSAGLSITNLGPLGGRLFYMIDEGPTSLERLPGKWFLVARDAFNGVALWKRPIDAWVSNLHPFRNGPYDLPRRLVAIADRVYVTLGCGAPVSCLDAATGKTLATYADTQGAEEIICGGGRLLVTIGSPAGDGEHKGQQAKAKGKGKVNVLLPEATAGAIGAIVVIDLATGRTLWKVSGADVGRPLVQTLAAADGRVVFQTDREIRCLDLGTSRRLWQTPAKTGGLCTVIVRDGVVLSADDSTVAAFSLAVGEPMWTAPCRATFHVSPDMFVIDGLVWAGTGKPDKQLPLLTSGRDLRTGEVKRQIDVTPDLWSTVAHHRCYKSKATERFILTAQRGVEFLDLHGNQHAQCNWIRGTCQHGFVPANGLRYFPPHACGCFAKGKVNGFYAVAGAPGPMDRRPRTRRVRLACPRIGARPERRGVPRRRPVVLSRRRHLPLRTRPGQRQGAVPDAGQHAASQAGRGV
jgi:outer membrane protein assembly factor BamB